MKTTITARHFTASPSLQDYARETLGKLEKFFDGRMECDLVLEEIKDHDEPQQAELIVRVAKATLTATEKAPTFEQSILKSVENMKRQLIKHKKKHFERA